MEAAARRVATLQSHLSASPCASTGVGADAVAPAGQYAVALPESLAGSSGHDFNVYRNAQFPHALVTGFPFPDEGVTTLGELWATAASRFPHAPCLGTRTVDEAGAAAGCVTR